MEANRNKDRLILTNVFLAIFVFTIILFSFNPNLTWIPQGCAILVVITFAFEVLKKGDFKFIVPLPLIIYLGFIIYASLSLLWTNQSVDMMSTLLQLFFISFIMINIVNYQGHFYAITFGFWAALLFATFDLWKKMGGLVNTNESIRVTSFLGNPNTFAIALFIGMLLAMESLLKETKESRISFGGKMIKVFSALLLLLFSYEIIFLTGSRKAMLSVFMLGFMIFLKYINKVKFLQKIMIIGCGIGILTELYFLLQESVFFVRLNRVFEMLSGKDVRDGSLTERSSMISDGWNLWKEKPITGWGTDQFRYLTDYQTYSHNNFVELLSNNGLIGLILYYSIFILMIIAGLKMLLSSKEEEKHIGFFSLATLLIFIFWDLAHVSYYSKFHWIMLSIIMGITCYIKSKPLINQSKPAQQ